jgi:hypothetical protein
MTRRNTTANKAADVYETGAGGGGGGQVDSIQPGLGIYVDNTDPVNPEVSADLVAGNQINLFAVGNAIQINAVETTVQPIMGIGVDQSTPGNVNLAALDLIFEYNASGVSPGAFYRGVRYIGAIPSAVSLTTWKTSLLFQFPATERAASFYIINAGTDNVTLTAEPGDLFNGAASYIVPPGQTSICIWTGGANWSCGILPPAPSEDIFVKADLADQTPNYLFSKMVAGSGINLSVVSLGPSDRAVLVSATSAATGFPNGQQLYEFATNQSEAAIKRDGAISPPAGGGDNSGTRGFGFVADRTMTAAAARIWISQTGGNNLRLGLYNASGNRIAQTNRFSPAVGIIQASFTSPVVLIGGQLYYMAYWCDDTTSNLRFLVITGRSTTTTSPLMQRHDPNEMPAAIASGLTNTAGRPWLMITE